VVLSRECYTDSIRTLFDYGQGKDELRCVAILNQLLAQVVKMPSASQEHPQKDDRVLHFWSLSTMSTLIIERSIKIFTSIALFLEGEKKRERQLKDERLAAKAKKRAEQRKKEASTGKAEEAKDAAQADQNAAVGSSAAEGQAGANEA
jgi:hypothetical protein